MSYFCNLSHFPMRLEPSHKSEMVSQLIFGEEFTIIETHKFWQKIKIIDDGYEGWVERQDFWPSTPEESKWQLVTNQSKLYSKNGNISLFPSAKIPKLENNPLLLDNESFSLEDLSCLMPIVAEEDFLSLLHSFLHTPYLWGGKTPHGIDCSGFTQVVFKCLGKIIPRDASQQFKIGEEINSLENIQLGDLAFFHNESGNITHVGILLKPNEIIHASEKVRIDSFNKVGIFRKPFEEATHHLAGIRRLNRSFLS